MAVKRISPEEARDLMDKEGYVYLDVRSVPEFAAGHPTGAYNIPLLDMCTSYLALPSASVSVRTIVAPGSLAFAAASTLLFVSPVSGVSSERCPPHGLPAVGGEA